MKFKKMTALLLSSVMAVSLAACGTAGNGEGKQAEAGTDSKNLYTVKWVTPGNEPERMDAVEKAINEKLIADGRNIQLEIVRIPWDAWDQKTNLMLTTGEEFDLLNVM